MTSPITAIYENGVLCPLTPLALPERARVQVHVEQVLTPTDAVEHRRLAREALVAAGLSLPTPLLAPTAPSISVERREELACLFATGRPL